MRFRFTELALLLMLSGCFNPDDIFVLRGSASAPTDQLVELRRAQTNAGRSQCDDAEPFKQTRLDADGGFIFEVFRAQTRHLGSGDRNCLRVQTLFVSGARAHADIFSPEFVTTVDHFIDWQPELHRDGGEWSVSSAMPSLMNATGRSFVAHRLVLETDDGGIAWAADDLVRFLSLTMETMPNVRVALRDDHAAWNEFAGTLAVKAQYLDRQSSSLDVVNVDLDGTIVEVRAPQRVVFDGGFVPPSRGVACPPLASPCPLTDGALEPFWVQVPSFTLKFDAPLSVHRAVLRGVYQRQVTQLFGELEDGGVVELGVVPMSARAFVVPERPFPFPLPQGDGGAFFVESPEFIVVDLDAGAPLRSVTFTRASRWGVLSEVSVH